MPSSCSPSPHTASKRHRILAGLHERSNLYTAQRAAPIRVVNRQLSGTNLCTHICWHTLRCRYTFTASDWINLPVATCCCSRHKLTLARVVLTQAHAAVDPSLEERLGLMLRSSRECSDRGLYASAKWCVQLSCSMQAVTEAAGVAKLWLAMHAAGHARSKR